MDIKLSIIIPTLDGAIRAKIPEREGVEVIVVKGVSPVGKARNEGLKRAKGEYIAWVDSDDEVEEGWLEEIVGILTQSRKGAEERRENFGGPAAPEGVDVVTFDAELVGWEGWPNLVWGVRQEKVTMERLRRDVYRDIIRPSAMWLYVTRKELWRDLVFSEKVRTAEDYLVFPKVIDRAKSCVYIPKMLYKYRRNAGSLVNTQDYAKVYEDFIVQEEHINTCNPKYRGKRVWGAALNFFWIWGKVMNDTELLKDKSALKMARKSRDYIKKHIGTVLRETICSDDFTLSDRIKTTFRFLTAFVGITLFHRIKAKWKR